MPTNLVHHRSFVRIEDRVALLKQRPATLWLTGLSGAGKSTLARTLEKKLLDLGKVCCVLDGDNIRHGLNRDLGFSPKDRNENVRRVAEVARLINDAGLIVITAFISPYRADREIARRIIGENAFFEIYLATPLSVCEERDPKGHYKRARCGQLKDFTGVSAPYEPPLNPCLMLDTSQNNIDECLTIVLGRMSSVFFT